MFRNLFRVNYTSAKGLSLHILKGQAQEILQECFYFCYTSGESGTENYFPVRKFTGYGEKLHDFVSQYTQQSKLLVRWCTHVFILWGNSSCDTPSPPRTVNPSIHITKENWKLLHRYFPSAEDISLWVQNHKLIS